MMSTETQKQKPTTELVNHQGGSNSMIVDYIQNNSIKLYDIEKGELPNFSKAEAVDISGDGEYWSPGADGESKDVVFDGIGPTLAKDFNSDKVIEIEAAFFIEPLEYDDNGNVTSFERIKSASKALKSEVSRFPIGFPMRVTYRKEKTGKKGLNYFSWKIQALHNAE